MRSLMYASNKVKSSGEMREGSENNDIAVAVPIDHPIMATPPFLRSALTCGIFSLINCSTKCPTWIARRSRKTLRPPRKSSRTFTVSYQRGDGYELGISRVEVHGSSLESTEEKGEQHTTYFPPSSLAFKPLSLVCKATPLAKID
jgi:hypothetical protein